MTNDELVAYLGEMTERAKVSPGGVEILCARMWKEFTPQALTLWTTPGVLEHIAQCLTPPAEDETEDDE